MVAQVFGGHRHFAPLAADLVIGGVGHAELDQGLGKIIGFRIFGKAVLKDGMCHGGLECQQDNE